MEIQLVKMYSDPQPDDNSQAFEKTYSDYWEMPREDWEEYLHDALESVGFSTYGYPERKADELLAPYLLDDGTHGVDTPKFTIRSYYWGDDDSLYDLPNLVAKEHDLEINWYKYPLRGNSCSRHITFEEFKRVVDEFAAEMRELAPELPDLRDEGGEEGFCF